MTQKFRSRHQEFPVSGWLRLRQLAPQEHPSGLLYRLHALLLPYRDLLLVPLGPSAHDPRVLRLQRLHLPRHVLLHLRLGAGTHRRLVLQSALRYLLGW